MWHQTAEQILNDNNVLKATSADGKSGIDGLIVADDFSEKEDL